MITPQDVMVVLLNYRGADDTVRCLRSLHAMHVFPGRIIVVDNNSNDGSVDEIVDEWKCFSEDVAKCDKDSMMASSPSILIAMKDNDGYSSGNNAGIRMALQDVKCKAIWILNNDVEVDVFALDALCECLNAHPDSGMCGSTVVRFHNRKTVQCAGGYGFSKILGTTPAVCGEMSLEHVLGLDPARVEASLKYLTGASLLVRREVFERMGFLDEAYFLYYEDAEFGLRAGQHGYGLSWAPASIVFHKEGGTTGTGGAACRPKYVDYLVLRNRLYTLCRYSPCLLPIAVVSYFGVMLKRVARGQADRIPLVCLALWHGLVGRLGRPDFLFPFTHRRVLLVSLRADFGGGPEHIWQLLKCLPDEVSACVACPTDYPYYERYCALVGKENVFVLPHRAFRCSSLFGLAGFCRNKNISVLHSHGKGAGVYARLLAFMTGIPCVHTFHGVHMEEYGPVRKWLYRIAEKGMSLLTRTGITVSTGEKAQIVAEGLMPATKLHLIENGVAVPDASSSLSVTPPHRVISISRFDMQKNSEFLVDILEALQCAGRLNDFRLIVVGDGFGREPLLAMARARHLDGALECVGTMVKPQELFEGALCYVSTSRWEGMPLAVLEAMAHGLPPVVTDVVGNRDVVAHGVTGMLYAEGDAHAAASALMQLADTPDLRAGLAGRAREHVRRHHDVRVMASATFDLLRDVASGAAGEGG